MASFRTGFKIFGEISLKQGLGRIRSFSEDRKPGQWLPEDQWAVRQPGSTCPDPCEKKKPPKPSKSWLSICRDPVKEPECDVRHNNCPPVEVKEDVPWYSLDNFIPKKKPEKPPPLQSCREEMKRKELAGEEVCVPDDPPAKPDCCMPKSEPCPAPVVTLSCPPPKELNITLWCERPCIDNSRIPIPCQSDRLPYDEFRPQKSWKPPPFSLPKKPDNASTFLPGYCSGTAAYSEFKQVDVPRPLYTRYKSVDLTNKYLMLCMTDVKCPEDNEKYLPVETLPSPLEEPSKPCEEEEEKKQVCPEKPIIEAGSWRPVKLKNAPKYTFRPKSTKFVERVVRQNPCPIKPSDLSREKKIEDSCKKIKEEEEEPPKVITGTLTDEPATFERETPLPSAGPPRWMYMICKPGAKNTPLVPSKSEPALEPDNSPETDGLKFYDGKDECLNPKPPPDPCLMTKKSPPERVEPVEPKPPATKAVKNRFVLMPPEYGIKYSRQEEDRQSATASDTSTFEKFIQVKTSQKTPKSYPPMKENILYDLQRLCPNPPLDPTKLNAPCRKPPCPPCPRPPQFYSPRCFSTFHPSTLGKLHFLQLNKVPRRTECEDTSGKCKVKELVPKPRPCPDKSNAKPDCAQIALPCCPKARVPPDCDVRRPLPPCKKKLPPRPSFSECAKDPPPCPLPTECNCWEKKKR